MSFILQHLFPGNSVNGMVGSQNGKILFGPYDDSLAASHSVQFTGTLSAGVKFSVPTANPKDELIIYPPLALVQNLPMDSAAWSGLSASALPTLHIGWMVDAAGDHAQKLFDLTPLPSAGTHRRDLILGKIVEDDSDAESTDFYNTGDPDSPIAASVSRERRFIIEWDYLVGTAVSTGSTPAVPSYFQPWTPFFNLLVDEDGFSEIGLDSLSPLAPEPTNIIVTGKIGSMTLSAVGGGATGKLVRENDDDGVFLVIPEGKRAMITATVNAKPSLSTPYDSTDIRGWMLSIAKSDSTEITHPGVGAFRARTGVISVPVDLTLDYMAVTTQAWIDGPFHGRVFGFISKSDATAGTDWTDVLVYTGHILAIIG
jgi:hypothetical protein